MANLPETVQWEAGIYQLETTDLVLAGAGGIDNVQPTQLGNRTAWLRARLETPLVRPAAHSTTYDLTVTALAVRAIRVIATQNYSGANTTILDLPRGEFLIINECRWPVVARGPSGVGVTVPARTSPNASAAVVYVDELDSSLLGTATPAVRAVDVTAVAPASFGSGVTTAVTVTGKGFLGVQGGTVLVGGQTVGTFTVVSDTQIDASIDGPTLGLAPGAATLDVTRVTGETDTFPVTIT